MVKVKPENGGHSVLSGLEKIVAVDLFFKLNSDDQMFLERAVCTNEQTTDVMFQSNEELPHLTSLEQKDTGLKHHIWPFY